MNYEFVTIRTAIDNIDSADRISKKLVSKHLAASVHLSKCKTYYRWEGQYCDGVEYELSILTRSALIPNIEDTLYLEHEYDCSEFIVQPIVRTTKAFADWINASTMQGGKNG